MEYPSPDLEELNLPENKEFVGYLTREIDEFLKNNGNSNTIMLFPPFNSYKRLLLHHLVESSYHNCGLSTFSIGQEPRRRTVVCLGSLRKNLLDDDAKTDTKTQRSRPVGSISVEHKSPVRSPPTADAEKAPEKPSERQRKSRKTISYYVPPHLRKNSLESEPATKKDKKDDPSADSSETSVEISGNMAGITLENAKTPPPCEETTAVSTKKVIKICLSEEKLEFDDWDPLYCGKGTCSVPNLVIPILDETEMSDISKEVGKVRIVEIVGPNSEEAESSDYVNGSMIEIYGLDDVRTADLAQIFGDYVHRGFRLRWIDEGHALGIFSSSKTAEEALASDFARVKIRPISQGTSLSQEIARNVVLPSSFRPKTCSSLAKRLLSGALGLKVSPMSPEERAAQRERQREVKDLRRKLSPM